jgi:putative transposase
VMNVLADALNDGLDPSMAQLCRALEVPRSTAYHLPRRDERTPRIDVELRDRIKWIIESFPTFGIRRVWAWLKFRMGLTVNRKKVARIMRRQGWTMKQRRQGLRPRVEIKRSVAEKPNQRWSTDIALVFCGARDGWCSFVAVMDCCTRELLGWELAHTARAKTAERALEMALIERFGWTHGAPAGLVVRSDNGLVFGSKLYREMCRDYRLGQEFITPYTPEENGMVERFIRSFKEECVWVNRFESIEEARGEITRWVEWYNTQRPHQALNYKTPKEVRQNHDQLAA